MSDDEGLGHHGPKARDRAEPEEWAIVEIMGHLRRAGRILEVDRFGAKLLRVDIPILDSPDAVLFVTEFFGGASIYRLRPCSKEIAMEAARQIGDPRPVMPVTARIAAPRFEQREEDEEEPDEFDHQF